MQLLSTVTVTRRRGKRPPTLMLRRDATRVEIVVDAGDGMTWSRSLDVGSPRELLEMLMADVGEVLWPTS